MVDHRKAAYLFEFARDMASATPAIGRKLSGNCVTVHYGVLQMARALFGSKVNFVIGHIEIAGNVRFQFTDDEVNSWRSGVTKPSYNLHAWLAVEGDILDLTLAATIHENEPLLLPEDVTYIDLEIADKHRIVYSQRLAGDHIPFEFGLIRRQESLE